MQHVGRESEKTPTGVMLLSHRPQFSRAARGVAEFPRVRAWSPTDEPAVGPPPLLSVGVGWRNDALAGAGIRLRVEEEVDW